MRSSKVHLVRALRTFAIGLEIRAQYIHHWHQDGEGYEMHFNEN